MNGVNGSKAGVRLLIVDAHGVVREGLLALFRQPGGVETSASNDAEVDWVMDRFAPDVVLIRLAPSNGHAMQTARSILGRCPAPRVMLLDDTVCPAHVCVALAIGASGYWTVRASFAQIEEAVRDVAGGKQSFCPAAQRLRAPLSRHLRVDPPGDVAGISSLTQRESEVLVLLAKGFTVKQCARRLRLSPSTVEKYKAQLMKKVGVHRLVDLVRLAWCEGLLGK